MGVYIYGMEMPKSCDECPMFNLDIDGGCYCTKYFVIRKKDQDRPDWCPLIPVPEHGRLIDADALWESIPVAYPSTMRAIEDVPTIIPADKEV